MRNLLLLMLSVFTLATSCKKGNDEDCESESASAKFRNETNVLMKVEISQRDETNQNFTAASLNFNVAANAEMYVEVPDGERMVRWSNCAGGNCVVHSIQQVDFTACEEYLLGSGGASASDARYKKNISAVANRELTEKLMKLEPMTYEYDFVKFPLLNAVKGNTYGFIAQDVEKVFPSTVIRDEEGYRSVNYTALIPVLTAVIQQQQQQIDALAKEVDALRE